MLLARNDTAKHFILKLAIESTFESNLLACSYCSSDAERLTMQVMKFTMSDNIKYPRKYSLTPVLRVMKPKTAVKISYSSSKNQQHRNDFCSAGLVPLVQVCCPTCRLLLGHKSFYLFWMSTPRGEKKSLQSSSSRLPPWSPCQNSAFCLSL